jgi:hypothetical protein
MQAVKWDHFPFILHEQLMINSESHNISFYFSPTDQYFSNNKKITKSKNCGLSVLPIYINWYPKSTTPIHLGDKDTKSHIDISQCLLGYDELLAYWTLFKSNLQQTYEIHLDFNLIFWWEVVLWRLCTLTESRFEPFTTSYNNYRHYNIQ